jgi:hypothetical protein
MIHLNNPVDLGSTMNEIEPDIHPELTTEQTAELQQVARGVLGTLSFWLSAFSPKFYSTAYIMTFLKLFSDPGLKKSELMLYLQNNAKISQSTAERMLGDAHKAGHIVFEFQGHGNALALFLSGEIHRHCAVYLSVRTKSAVNDFEQYEGSLIRT